MRASPASRLALCVAACAALLLLLVAGRAVAQAARSAAGAAPPLQLDWVSSEPSCNGDIVATRALQMVGPGVSPRRVEARAKLSRDGEAWVVDLETRSANHTGKRTLNGDSCKELQEALALLLSMILESETDVTAPPAASPPTKVAPPPTNAPSSRASQFSPVPAAPDSSVLDSGTEGSETNAPRSWSGLLRLDGDAALGLKPSLGLGIGAAVGVQWQRWDFAVVGAYWPATRTDIRADAGVLDITRLSFGVRACFTAWSQGRLSLAPCLTPEMVLFSRRSLGILEVVEGTADEPLRSGTVALDLRYQLLGRSLSAVLSPGVTFEQRQPFTLVLRCNGEPCARETVYETSGVAPRLKIGLDARF